MIKKYYSKISLVILVSFGLFNTLASACENMSVNIEEYGGNWLFTTDNDLWGKTGVNEDNDYSFGIGGTRSGSWVKDVLLYSQINSVLNKFDCYALDHPNSSSDYSLFHSGSLTLNGFTPNAAEGKLLLSDPVNGQRPYASLLGFTVNHTYVADLLSGETDLFQGHSQTSSLTLGIFGTNLGNLGQTFIHERGDSDIPRGWHNQIADGGAPTFLYRLKTHNLTPLFNQNRYLSLSYTYDYSLGYYVEVGGSILLRGGKINSPHYQHTSNPLSLGNHTGWLKDLDAYIFIEYGGRFNVYNELLQGSPFKSGKLEYSYDEIRHGFREWNAGFVLGKDHVKLSMIYASRDSELVKANNLDKKSHDYAGIVVSWKIP